jgi:hypothetical protein
LSSYEVLVRASFGGEQTTSLDGGILVIHAGGDW